jgi:predicted transcriptional regulator
MAEGQNLTIRLDRETIRKARVLAAQQGTSVSKLLARYVERMVMDEAAYDAARRRALAHLDAGFHLGGEIHASRDEWHER